MRFVSAYNSYSRAPRGILAYIVVDIPYMDDAFKLCFEVSHNFLQFDMYIIDIDGYSILQDRFFQNSLFLGHEELRHSMVDFSIFPELVEGKVAGKSHLS